ncbi:MAG: tetratricopeptide repeat protein [Candidatus Eisenbacteria bacterium]|nr:tetratricopeptide repeat protein [Candidatus Eisenbacteria bacterium]
MLGNYGRPESPAVLLLGLLFLLAVAGLIVWILRRRRPAPRPRYVEALNALLEGDEENALRELRQTVQVDPTNTDAYLRLGSLLRKRGALDRALRIHRDLDVGTILRRKLSAEEKARVREAIADDLLALRRTEEALQVLSGLLAHDKENARIRSKMVALHERRSEWDEAYELFREGMKIRKEKAPEKLARYRAICGSSVLQAGDAERAKLIFLEALKLHPECAEALYRLGAIAYDAGEMEEAIGYWERFHQAAPELAYVTFDRLEQALFETGNLNRLEEVFQAILGRAPENPPTLLALSDFYSRRGEDNKAIDSARRAVESDPSSSAARSRLLYLLCTNRTPERAVREAADFLKENPIPTPPLACPRCGFPGEEPFWRCPQCLTWNAAAPGPATSSSRS